MDMHLGAANLASHRRAREYDRVALVLQGGGALGAYQAGVYEALGENGCLPNWLSGVSIGAVNAALIAGNPPERRIERMRDFWNTVSGRKIWAYTPEGDMFRAWRNQASAHMTMYLGQPGFFQPRPLAPWWCPAGSEGATSYYDTSRLRETLERLIDFDLLNRGDIRFSVGAVNVRTGNFVYFDNQRQRIGPEHVMASGALPPALPAVKIEGEFYWDGGIVSNTPLQYLLEQEDGLSSLVFQVDLFSAHGSIPRDMPAVMSRQKDIVYSSRTRQNTDQFRRQHALKSAIHKLLARLPADARDPEIAALGAEIGDPGSVNIVHLIYQQKTYEGQAKDYEFSGTSMREHWQAGYDDTRRTLRHDSWLALPTGGEGIRVHDLHRDAEF
jgi:NTE family protein